MNVGRERGGARRAETSGRGERGGAQGRERSRECEGRTSSGGRGELVGLRRHFPAPFGGLDAQRGMRGRRAIITAPTVAAPIATGQESRRANAHPASTQTQPNATLAVRRRSGDERAGPLRGGGVRYGCAMRRMLPALRARMHPRTATAADIPEMKRRLLRAPYEEGARRAVRRRRAPPARRGPCFGGRGVIFLALCACWGGSRSCRTRRGGGARARPPGRR